MVAARKRERLGRAERQKQVGDDESEPTIRPGRALVIYKLIFKTPSPSQKEYGFYVSLLRDHGFV